MWDPVKKAWVNKDGDDNEGAVTAPPPTDNDLMGKAALVHFPTWRSKEGKKGEGGSLEKTFESFDE